MRRARGLPSFSQGIVAALVLSLCGAALLAALAYATGPATALRVVIAALSLGYVLYLLGRAEGRVGRATTLLLWSLASVAAWFAAPPLAAYALLHIGLISAVRALWFRSRALAALADLGLGLLGAAFAVWAAARSGSPLLAFWCFFLVQALSASIPPAAMRATKARSKPEEVTAAAFDRAYRTAEAALRRLAAK